MICYMEPFTHTSDEPYDQNQYRLVFENGESVESCSYQNLRDYWLANGGQLGGVRMDHIDFAPLEETNDGNRTERETSGGAKTRVYRKGSKLPEGF